MSLVLGLFGCYILWPVNFPFLLLNFNIMFYHFFFSLTQWVGGGGVLCHFLLSNSCNNTCILSRPPDLLPPPLSLTPLIVLSVSSLPLPPSPSHKSHPSCSSPLYNVNTFSRSPVCGVPAESEDSHIEPRSHTARGQAYVF